MNLVHIQRIILVLCIVISSGCASVFYDQTVVVPSSSGCLIHLKQAREYVASGRYELAKEQYLMALAASADTEATETITDELHAVDLMIQSQR